MSKRRFILEIGMGNDQYGKDYQKAAARAVESAIRRSAIPMFATTGLDHKDMDVRVTVGVQEPDKVVTEELRSLMPRGTAKVEAVHGGQNVHNPETGDTIVIATAAIEAFFEDQSKLWIKA
ncbi:MAG: Lin0512 family protein [Pseudomonadota bacterium]